MSTSERIFATTRFFEGRKYGWDVGADDWVEIPLSASERLSMAKEEYRKARLRWQAWDWVLIFLGLILAMTAAALLTYALAYGAARQLRYPATPPPANAVLGHPERKDGPGVQLRPGEYTRDERGNVETFSF